MKGLVEVNTPPVHTLAELERDYVENLGLALGAPLTLRLRLYPLGTYPLPLEPVIRDGPDYRVQARTIGPERFVDAGRYAGTHLHLELPAGTVSPGASARRGAQPLQSCNGPRPGPHGPDPLVSLLRGAGDRPSRTHGPLPGRRLRVGRGIYTDLPEVGGLLPYADDADHLVRQQFDGYRAWLEAMDRVGVERRHFVEAGGDLLRPAWNPVRLSRQETLDLHGMDSNFAG